MIKYSYLYVYVYPSFLHCSSFHQILKSKVEYFLGELIQLHFLVKNQIEKDSHCANLLTPDQSPNEKQKVIRVKNQIRRPFATDGGGVVYNQGFRLPPECGSSDLKPALEYKSGQSDMDAKKLESFFIERVAKFA